MTALSTPRLGKDSVLYRNAGSYGTPSLVTLRNCMNVKVPMSVAEDDVSARITGGFEAMVATLQKIGLTFEMKGDDGADWTAIRTAFFARSVVEMFIFNGAATSATALGVRVTMQVFKFEESQDNTKANTYEIEMKPTWPDPTATATATAVVGGSTWTVAS